MPIVIPPIDSFTALPAGRTPASFIDEQFAKIFDAVSGQAASLTDLAGAAAAIPSIVRGAVGAYASATTWTLTSAAFLAFFNPTSGVINKLVTAQGALTVSTATQGRNGLDYATPVTASTWH